MTPLLLIACLLSPTAPNARPEPVFVDLSGQTVRLSGLEGEVVLLNFWATWCAPCRHEMPVFVRLHEELAPRGLRVVGASVNGRSEAETVREAMREMDMEFPVWLWANAYDMAHYGVGPGLPATLVVGRDGRVLYRYQGVVTERRLRPVLEKLLPPAPLGAAPLPDEEPAASPP